MRHGSLIGSAWEIKIQAKGKETICSQIFESIQTKICLSMPDSDWIVFFEQNELDRRFLSAQAVYMVLFNAI